MRAEAEAETAHVLSAAAVKAEAERLGFDACGIAGVGASGHTAFLREWLDAGRHGTMSYLAREDAVQARTDPRSAWPQLRTAIVLALGYDSGATPAQYADRGVIARYAHGRDYHKVIRRRLLELLRALEQQAGRALPLARAYVDTGPLLERELAQRAGLGWFGRNTMLVNPRRGSYFFLATLLVELDVDTHDAPFTRDHCGSCSACVSACPTDALLGRDANGAPVMDATRCIAYLTIENRGPIPRELRPLVGNRVFGCDICQEVCPWNAPKFVSLTRERDFSPRSRTTDASLVELMRMRHDEWDEWTRGSAIRRAGYAGLKRNVAVALGNCGSDEAASALIHALSEAEPLIRGHAGWALGRIGSRPALAALAEQLQRESDPWVREELELALAI
jgi:epoxyqueuosine reductase